MSDTSDKQKTAFFDIGGRRFLLAVLTLASINVMLWWDKMGDAIYRDILIAVIAVYVAGNTIQKIRAPDPNA